MLFFDKMRVVCRGLNVVISLDPLHYSLINVIFAAAALGELLLLRHINIVIGNLSVCKQAVKQCT